MDSIGRSKEAMSGTTEVSEAVIDDGNDEQRTVISEEFDPKLRESVITLHTKADKVFNFIRQELTIKERIRERERGKDGRRGQFDFFVDRMRQAASNYGKKDLKKDVMLCQKKQKGQAIMQRNKLSTKTLLNQGVYEMKMKLYPQAVSHLNVVIEDGGDTGLPYILRSRCLTFLEQHSKALEDANKALELKKNDIRAILAKAESLFASGHFEMALVEFEKGSRILNTGRINKGIEKCQQAILNSVGSEGITFSKKLVRQTLKAMENEKTDAEIGFGTTSQRSSRRRKHKYVNREVPLKFSNLLDEEQKFLQRLKTIENFNFEPGFRIKGVDVRDAKPLITSAANDALKYVNKRKEFWDEIPNIKRK